MKLRLPQYSSKDYLVLLLILLPLTLIMNSGIFGSRYFSEWKILLTATLLTPVAFTLFFILCGGVAVFMKKRFPDEEQTGKKLGFMIGSFLLMTGLFLVLLFRGYEKISFLNYSFYEQGFVWAYIGLGIINIFLTFLFEGISRFENWKASMKETEQLRKSYKQSQLQALKSQVNPHFLFNSLNSLSSLISEEGDEAEKFLDEMTKVYRYMLRNDVDQLVAVGTELKFLESYLYLLKARYGDGLLVNIEVDEKDKEKHIPPLTLQVLIENAFTQNTISKSNPLKINIHSGADEAITVCNNVQAKMMTETTDRESGLDNLVKNTTCLTKGPY